MKKEFKYSLFEVFGVELEYMIVDKDTLKTLPICDKLLFDFAQNYSGDFNNGSIDWSNELVAHVVEIKVASPVSDLEKIANDFHENVVKINQALLKYNAMLLPTAAHPLFNPNKETVLWQHEHNEIYELYNKVFNCQGHGWSNLQSIHLNLPFKNDEEFGKLHAAIRLLLPIIPALAASSPIIEGKSTGKLDTRMDFYINNQKEIPSLMGKLIPEPAYSEQAYYDQIFSNIIKDFTPYDDNGIMEHHFLNSRGAIARFDRGAIEIRVTDIQECPKADLSILNFIVESIKYIIAVNEKAIESLQSIDEEFLFEIFKKSITDGLKTSLNDDFTKHFKCGVQPKNIGQLLEILLDKVKLPMHQKEVISTILVYGNLSQRILKNLESGKSVEETYQKLSNCLKHNQLFLND